MKDTKAARFNMRIEPDLLDAITACAQANGRTLAGEIRWALNLYVRGLDQGASGRRTKGRDALDG